MKIKILLILIILVSLIFGCGNVEKTFESKDGNIADLQIKLLNGNSYYLSLKLKNTTSDLIGIICIGNIREKQHTHSKLGKILNDVIIEIKQEDRIISSDQLTFPNTTLSERIHKLLIVQPNSEYSFPIFYRGDLKKDFRLNDSNFQVRLILEPTTNDSLISVADREYLINHGITLYKNKIVTPFTEVNN